MATQQCSELILTTAQLAEFFRKMIPGAPGECWLGKPDPIYARVFLGKRRLLLHRASYAAHFGRVPENTCVLHTCDHPPCWNWDHFFLGTNADNTADAMRKGRTSRGERHSLLTKAKALRGEDHPFKKHPELALQFRGEGNPAATITETIVREIRTRRLAGELVADLRAVFGLGQTQMYRILNGECWPDVDPPHARFDDRRRPADQRTAAQMASSELHSERMKNR